MRQNNAAYRAGNVDIQVICARVYGTVAAIAVSRISARHQIGVAQCQAGATGQVYGNRVTIHIECGDLDHTIGVYIVDVERNVRHGCREVPAEFAGVAIAVCDRLERAVVINRITVRDNAVGVQQDCSCVRLVAAGINSARIGNGDVAGILGETAVDLGTADAFPFKVLADGRRLAAAVAKDHIVTFATRNRVVTKGAVIQDQRGRVVEIDIRDVDARVAGGGRGVNEFDPRNRAFDGYVYRVFRAGCRFVTAQAFGCVDTEQAI